METSTTVLTLLSPLLSNGLSRQNDRSVLEFSGPLKPRFSRIGTLPRNIESRSLSRSCISISAVRPVRAANRAENRNATEFLRCVAHTISGHLSDPNVHQGWEPSYWFSRPFWYVQVWFNKKTKTKSVSGSMRAQGISRKLRMMASSSRACCSIVCPWGILDWLLNWADAKKHSSESNFQLWVGT